MSQDELAKAANVGLSTVRDFEKGRRTPIANNLTAIQSELEKRGVRFVDRDENGTCAIFHTEPIAAQHAGQNP
jgi:transcriptional regulator with XRE-family HTH domain